MKTLFPITLMIIALLFSPAMGDDETMPQRALYEGAIDEEIAQCRQLASLLTSRSANLRMKGHREASMAMFLETHRDQLVDGMMAQDVELKAYKVERYLNDRFRCTCYAVWDEQL